MESDQPLPADNDEYRDIKRKLIHDLWIADRRRQEERDLEALKARHSNKTYTPPKLKG